MFIFLLFFKTFIIEIMYFENSYTVNPIMLRNLDSRNFCFVLGGLNKGKIFYTVISIYYFTYIEL